ncbi:L-threonylcarbamoyladenylate synthase [Occallatibacter riparius]|uniref:Threonylcarbamoyl-AMP synthase n=1 Tax=Occallatibacter riparius TaxID=1002689 RepID=A0A9J7BIA1_9BACT|nr:L-threonylcarbamoyladenylate synthase [Occallatibacter riparius]UWZ82225.1 threonylcarbamoyl-AMP synthase [Occallatibacter riparius]
MNTLRLRVDPAHLEGAQAREEIARAAGILRAGGLVALPTETVYGLGANALDADAVARIFAAKRRPAWDPVIVHVAGPVENNPMLAPLVIEIPEAARKLMVAFWPGPLTLLLPRSKAVPDAVTAGRPLVGVRMPAHPVAFRLIEEAGVPVAAPSANLFSHTSPTTGEHVLHDLDGRIDAILDAGPAEHGVESTVIDPCQSPMVIYRPGAITVEQIRAVAGKVEVHRAPLIEPGAEAAALPSPGVGIRHYAPRAKLILVEGSPAELEKVVGRFGAHRVGVMLPAEWGNFAGAEVFEWGRWDSMEELAAGLYAGLRALDRAGCEVIVCPVPPGDGIGAAIRDRLRKASFHPQD